MMNDSSNSKEDLSVSDLSNSNTPYTKRKILLLGGQNVGKTALIKRFKNNIYVDDYEPTIQITTKKIIKLNNEYIELEIVDLEGQNEYTIFSPNKFSFGYNGYMLVYDVKDKNSFDLIKHIYEQINNLSGKTSKILIGAKSDNNLDSSTLSDRQVSFKEGQKYAEIIHCPFIEVSSQDNKNIEEAFRQLLFEINKTESGFYLKKLRFYNLYQFFIHHQKLAIYCFYINLIILIFFSLFIVFEGIKKEILLPKDKKNHIYYYGIGFPFIILGLWEILFSVCGIFGIYYKNEYLLGLNHLGFIYSGVYLFLSIFQINLINILDGNSYNPKDIFEQIYLFLINIIPLIITIFLSKIFKTIYKQELQSYMA